MALEPKQKMSCRAEARAWGEEITVLPTEECLSEVMHKAEREVPSDGRSNLQGGCHGRFSTGFKGGQVKSMGISMLP